MSLKAMHVFFISLSVALSAIFGVWGFRQATPLYSVLGAASAALGLALVAYLVRFLKKLKGVGFL